MKHCRVKVSWLWIPFLLGYPFLPLFKTLGFIFAFLSIHEAAHILTAHLFHYPIRKVILYPFGLCAVIDSIGYRSGCRDLLILCAGPATHLIEPLLLKLCLWAGWISQPYFEYLCMMNLSILIFNLLPVYPLDGGRITELLLQLFFPYLLAGKLCNLLSIVLMMILYAGGVFAGISGVAVCILMVMENVMAYRRRPFQRARFYEYRIHHPVSYPIRMNTGKDLYRFSNNVMYRQGQWIPEACWLRFF